MDRYARRVYFERLCELREANRQAGPDDTTSVISIEDAIAYVNEIFDKPDAVVYLVPEHSSGQDA
jgi:hypothetical protein